jgi:hypothetical protein
MNAVHYLCKNKNNIKNHSPNKNKTDSMLSLIDEMFLEALNKRRRSKGLSNISACTFESVVDRLEKEWHSVVKNLPSNIVINGQLVSTDSEKIPCVICDESDVENSNVMVFCDGCNIAVHEGTKLKKKKKRYK